MKRFATSVQAAAASALFLFALVASPLVGTDFSAFGSGSSNTGPDRDVLDATAFGSGSSNTGPDRDVLDVTAFGSGSSNTGPDRDVLD